MKLVCLITLMALAACSGSSLECDYTAIDGKQVQNSCVAKTW